jgi:hypothetical protein
METANPDILNKRFERETFEHRALIHAHVSVVRKLWGVLQPSVFGLPGRWTQLEQTSDQRN